jgi:DNA-binding NtrC family response regulator
MNDHPQIDILHKLAVTPPNNSLFENPIDYLKWFLKQVNGFFNEANKIRFANIQYFSALCGNQSGFVNGRLINIPTLLNLNVVKIETITKTLRDVTGFLAATSIIQNVHSEANKVTINTFRDKLKIETIRAKTLINSDDKMFFNLEQNLLTIYIPDLYDPSISTTLLGNEFYLSNELVIEEFEKGRIILDGVIINDKLEKFFSSEKLKPFIGEVQKFINSPSIQKLMQQYLEDFFSIDYFKSFNELKDQVQKFIITALLHSWFKPNRFDYQIVVSKYDRNEPIAYGSFLINTDAQLDEELLNYLQIAMNIAFNNLSDILAWYLPKPNHRLAKSSSTVQLKNFETNKDSQLIYQSLSMRAVDFEITKLARTDESVLLLGETGVGKDFIANEIHNRSNRKDKPFVSVPLSSLSEQIIESELFGSEKGSYTGSIETRKGKFEQADGGTLYLPEISEIPLTIQIKLLEFLQYKFISKVGGGKAKLNIRLIFASNSNLEKLIAENKLRSDFYYRICVLKLMVPALRERKEDILPLANYFTKKHSLRIFGEEYSLDSSVDGILTEQNWDGNVRQLENLIISSIVKADNKLIDEKTIARSFKDLFEINGSHHSELDMDFKSTEKEFKKKYFTDLLKQTNGCISETARIAGLSRQAVYKILNELEIKF